MLVSENVLKWALRVYPPLLFQRIWVLRFHQNFSGVSVKINKSFLNKNYNRSIFGGTIFAAADPFYPLLFHQILSRNGYKVRIWVKSAQIEYIKPGNTHLYFNISIPSNAIDEIEQVLKSGEKHIKAYPIEMYNKVGELCVSVSVEIYIRNLNDENNNK